MKLFKQIAKNKALSSSTANSTSSRGHKVVLAGLVSLMLMGSAVDAANLTPQEATKSQYIVFRATSSNGNDILDQNGNTTTATSITFNDSTYLLTTVTGTDIKYWVRQGYDITGLSGGQFTVAHNSAYDRATSDENLMFSYTQSLANGDQSTVYANNKHTGSLTANVYGAASTSTTTRLAMYAGSDYTTAEEITYDSAYDANDSAHNTKYAIKDYTQEVVYDSTTGKYKFANEEDGKGDIDADYVYAIVNNSSGEQSGTAKTYVFTTKNNNETITRADIQKNPVYGCGGEIVVTGTDDKGNMYSAWGTKVDASQVTAEEISIEKYVQNYNELSNRIHMNYQQLPKAVTATSTSNGGTLNVLTEGGKSLNGITVKSEGGTNGNDTKVTFSSGTYTDENGNTVGGSFSINTGSKVSITGPTAGTGKTVNTWIATVNGTPTTITDTDTTYSQGENITIDANNQISAKDTKLADVTLNGKTLTVTDTDGTTKSVQLDGITSGLSSTDYRLVKNSKTENGNYTVDKTGKVALTVQDAKDASKTDTVTIDGIAVVYDGQGSGKGNLISTNSLGSNDPRGGSIVLGDKAQSSGYYSTVTGTNSKITTDNTTYTAIVKTEVDGQTVTQEVPTGKNVQGTMSTVTGSYNTVSNSTKGDAGVANSITGSVNTVTNSNGVVIQGTGNTVTNAYNQMTFSQDELKTILAAVDSGDTEAFLKLLASKDSGAVAVIGGANTISETTYTTDIGFGNTITGSKDVFAAGSHNTLTNMKNSLILGNDITMSDREGVVSLGNNNSVTKDFAVAIGDDASVTEEGGVALGASSVANRASGKKGYLADTAKAKETDSTWYATAAAVSVGGTVTEDGETKTITRQITNVAAGTEATDAVNVAQLQQVKSDIEASSYKGWKVSTNKGTAEDVKTGETVDFSNSDKNIAISQKNTEKGTDIDLKLADDVTINKSLQVGNTFTANANGVVVNGPAYIQGATTITDGTAGITVNNDKVYLTDGTDRIEMTGNGTVINGITVGSKDADGTSQIHGVAAGTADTDAVNLSQLKSYASSANTDTHIDTSKTYSVSADNEVKLDVVDKDNKATGAKVTITDVAKASDVGKVSDIAADLQSKDSEGKATTTVVSAVNKLNNKVGDLNYYNEDGSKKYTGDIENGDSTTEAIGKLSSKIADVASKHTTLKEKTGNLIVKQDGTDSQRNYDVSLSNELDLTKDGSVTIGNTLINNDGLKVGSSSLTADALNVGGKTYIDQSGLNANSQKVTHVAAGDISSSSTDAVNGSQLYATNQRVENNSQNISNLYNHVGDLYGDVDKLSGRINRVGAGAAALAALHPLDFDPDDKWDFAAGYGNYRGANATAVGAYYRPNEDTMFSVGGAFGGGENLVNVGFSVKLGRGSNNVSTSRVAVAKEVKELRSTVEDLTALVNQLVAENAAIKAELAAVAPERFQVATIDTDEEGNAKVERVRAIEDEAE